MPEVKWRAFEASFEGDPKITFMLEVRQGSRPYIPLPTPPNIHFEPGQFSRWAVITSQQLVSVTGKPLDARVVAVEAGKSLKSLAMRISPDQTEFERVRAHVRAMDKDERASWVKAVAIEEAERTKGKAELPYAWNRVARACHEATTLETLANSADHIRGGDGDGN